MIDSDLGRKLYTTECDMCWYTSKSVNTKVQFEYIKFKFTK